MREEGNVRVKNCVSHVGGWGWEYGFDIRKSSGPKSEPISLRSPKAESRLSLPWPPALCYPVLVTPCLFLVLLRAVI